MRTYIDWLHEAEFQLPGANRYNNDYPALTEKIIKQIQLDAWKQGMLDAAKVNTGTNILSDNYYVSAQDDLRDAIVAAADDPTVWETRVSR